MPFRTRSAPARRTRGGNALPAEASRRHDRVAVLALAGAVAFVFRSGLGNGLVADDYSLINYCRPEGLASVLGAFDPWREVWYYRPFTKILFALGYTLFGTAAPGYHVASLLAHAAAVVLLYAVARRAGAGPLPSFAGALVFAVHFRQHESVFWFSAISYPLSTALGLASALFFRAHLARKRPAFLAAALAASAAAVLTKESSVVLPVLAALYGLLFAGEPLEGAPLGEKMRRVLPLACVALVGVALQAVPVSGRPFMRGGAGFTRRSVPESLEFAGRAAALVVPRLDGRDEEAPRAAALVAAAIFASWVLLRRTRLASFGFTWAVLAHLPFYAFVPRMGDLYLYVPLAGVALVVVDAATFVVSEAVRPALRAVAAVLLASFVTWSSSRIAAKAARWHAAGEVVGGIVAEVKAARPALPRGGTLVLEGLPDFVDGVYAFLNAAPAAFWLAYDDRTLTVVRPPPGTSRDVPADARFLYEQGRFYELEGAGRRLLRTFAPPD